MTDHDRDLAELRVQVKTIDAGLLGRRIRHARQRAGMTQGDAAGTDMSTAYISRIEAGQRRPGADLLVSLAERLRCTPEELLAPDDSVITYDAAVVSRLTLELDYADLEVRTGSAERALERVEEVLDEAARTTAVPPELRNQARFLRALALEATGDRNAAIDLFEQVVRHDDDSLRLIKTYIALSRCYRDSTDYARATDIGDRAAAALDERQLTGSAEGLQLAVTVAAAFYERGDVNHAVRMCERALARAEQLDSPQARAAAYWNTSIMESRQGRIESALPMAKKALALLEAAEDSRSQTRMRIQLGLLHLRTDPPLAAEAMAILTAAQRDSAFVDVNDSDRAHLNLGLARAHFMQGDIGTARDLAGQVIATTRELPQLIGADALVLLGEVSAELGDRDGATQLFCEASTCLEQLGDQHGVAQLWFELGGLFDQQDLYQESARAYRAAGATNGLGLVSTRTTVGAR